MLYRVVFIKGRENAKGIYAADLNDPNIYIRDIVAMFKPLLRLTPLVKFFYTTTILLCKRCTAIHISLHLLW